MEKKVQLFFYDANKFIFRHLPLEYSCLLEKSGDKIKRAWRHSYAGQYAFSGYKNITADTVTLGFARDIFLDPHGKIPETADATGKPGKGELAISKWIAAVATVQRQIYRSMQKNHTTAEYINYGLMGVIFIEILGWGIRFGIESWASRMGGH